ncbi:MAG: tyrosine-type recombinase/integrase [Actinomycetota bacterium]
MATRRKAPFPGLSRRPNGAWRLDKTWRDPATGVYHRRTTTFPARLTSREAVAEAVKWTSELHAGHMAEGGRIATAAWWERFISHKELTGLSPVTTGRYRGVWKNDLAPKLAHLRLDRVTRGDCQAAVDAAVARGLSAKSVQEVAVLAHGLFAVAVRDGRLSRNPCTPPLTCPEVRNHRPEPPGPALVAALLDASKGSVWEVPLMLLAYSGCRRSEALGTCWCDVADDFSRLKFTRGLQVVGKPLAPRMMELKSTSSVRQVLVPAPLAATLKTQRQRQREDRLLLGPQWVTWAPDHDGTPPRPCQGLICTERDGSPLNPESLTAAFRRFADKVGIPRWNRMHDLRHAAATQLLHAGVPVHVVSAQLGHSSPQITWGTYSHVLREQREQARDALEAAYGGVLT